eukprot:12884104-Prorocentrum_lima.AAC.1
MVHRLKRGEASILIPWVAPIKLKSDAPKEILRLIDTLPTLGALRGMWPIQIVRVQSDNGGSFMKEHLISGCRSRGVNMSQIPPCKSQSN